MKLKVSNITKDAVVVELPKSWYAKGKIIKVDYDNLKLVFGVTHVIGTRQDFGL